MKPAAPTDRRGSIRGGPGTTDPGLFVCTNIPLRALLLRAWALPAFQRSGPRSIETERYDIVAKVPPGASKDDLNRMIRNLLAERLGLVVHLEKKELPIYEMFIAQGGLKMKEAEPPGSPHRDEAAGRGVTRVTARMQSITDVLTMMGTWSGRPVVDKTGLAGQYDYTLVFANDAAGSADSAGDPAPPFLAAIVQQFGLRLESRKGAIDILRVDSFNKVPAEN